MTTVRFEDFDALPKPSWPKRLWVHLLAWQARRAQRVMNRHADLIADCSMNGAHAFPISHDVIWSVVHHGMTSEIGVRADPPARDFSAL